jgi:hypothetical protein
MEWILALFTLFAVLVFIVWWIGHCDQVGIGEAKVRFSLP